MRTGKFDTRGPMRKRRFRIGRYVLLIALLVIAWVAMREGYPPARFSPLPMLQLNRQPGFLTDLQIAGLKRDPLACRQVLSKPWIKAVQIPPRPIRNGCGIPNGVRISEAGSARISVGRLSCEAAAALALWMAHGVQPAAVRHLGHRVRSIRHYGTYACRNIRTKNRFLKNFRSEHARGNAIDIAGFTLTNGRTITLTRHWKLKNSAEGRFLREVHARACAVFRVVLGPEANAYHADHFHFDRGWLMRCK